MQTYIHRNGERRGPFEDADIAEALSDGVYSPDDLAWREGMPDWLPLRSLYPPEPPPVPVRPNSPVIAQASPSTPVEFHVRFGAGRKPDGFGFVRSGTMRIHNNRIIVNGPRKWHALARVCVFLVSWGIVWGILYWVFGTIGHAVGGFVGATLSFGGGNIITAAVVTLWLVQSYCASPGELDLGLGSVTGVKRSDARITFEAADNGNAKRKTAALTAASPEDANLIERRLHTSR